jgi:hypothetical protein
MATKKEATQAHKAKQAARGGGRLLRRKSLASFQRTRYDDTNALSMGAVVPKK